EVGSLKHGALTFALLETGWSDDSPADNEPADEKVTLRELLQFARDEVPRMDRDGFKRSRKRKITARDVELVDPLETYKVQTPILLDFSKTKDELVLMRLKKKKQD
ncbi:MAG: hypothetical protein K2Z81_18095, partial [Cyanobacteria bacterium]|nr:hypothetical protein [Cyanobacteriota bacterium]